MTTCKHCGISCAFNDCQCSCHKTGQEVPAPIAQPECNAVHPANEDTYCRRKKGHSGNHSAPCFVGRPSGASSIDWSSAPVAQVDAGKRKADWDTQFPCRGSAVAQTGLPPIPDDLKEECENARIGAVNYGDSVTGAEYRMRIRHIERIASLTQRLQEKEAECARRKAQSDDIQREIFNSHTEYETQLTALQASHDALLDAVKIYRVAPIRTFPVIRAIDTAIAAAEKLRQAESEQK